jgi:hypothetical protein
MAQTSNIDMGRDVLAQSQLHVTVQVKTRWITRLRLDVGLFLIKCAAKIIGNHDFIVDFQLEPLVANQADLAAELDKLKTAIANKVQSDQQAITELRTQVSTLEQQLATGEDTTDTINSIKAIEGLIQPIDTSTPASTPSTTPTTDPTTDPTAQPGETPVP